MHAGKIVLVSKSAYTPEIGEALLRQFVEEKIELFCAVGVDAANWEEALDWLCIGPAGESIHFITTTSHPDESIEEVISFAKTWHSDHACEVEVVYA
ncbi:MAG: hypothetical protein V4627_07295 [Pseudomonadota bacterium]